MSTEPVPAERGGRTWAVVAAVAVAVVLVALVAWLLLGRDGDSGAAPTTAPTTVAATDEPAATTTVTETVSPSTAPPTTESPATSPAPTATGTATGAAGTPPVVWHQRDQERVDGVRLVLVPERAVGASAGADTLATVRAALDHLLSAPPLDPDHANPWAAGGGSEGDAVLDVRATDGGGTTVDVPAAAFDGSVGSDSARLAVAALVRTVVTNDGEAPVTVLVDGQPGAEVWGVLSLDEPQEPSTDDLAGGWVLDPYEGQRVPAGPVTVSGTATAFEANVLWEVLDDAGTTVDSGFTMAGANGEYGPFEITVDLAPGTYTVRVYEESAAGPDEGVPVVWEHTTTVEVV
jgi:hypothetical protein